MPIHWTSLKRSAKRWTAIQAELPSGLDGRIAYDATAYIDNAIREVIKTLVPKRWLIVVIHHLSVSRFLSIRLHSQWWPFRSRSSVVFLMQVLGFTINLLTLLAIVLSVGLVVDDAIVVVENVERHLGEGKPPLEAALTGARELVGPMIAMTVVLAAVYTPPSALQGGLTGSLFREFAFTLAGAVIISGVVALTLSPMMSSKLLDTGNVGAGFRRQRFPEASNASPLFTAVCWMRTLDARPAVYRGLGRGQPAGHSHVYHVAQGTGPHRGSGGHLRHPGSLGQLDP
jgi:multidrug efflux pump